MALAKVGLLTVTAAFLAAVCALDDQKSRSQCTSKGVCAPSVGAGSLLQTKVQEELQNPIEEFGGDGPLNCLDEGDGLKMSYRDFNCPVSHATKVFTITTTGGDLSVQIENMTGISMMVYTHDPLATRCEQLRETTGDGQYRLINGNAGVSGGGRNFGNDRNFSNETDHVGYSWTIPLSEGSSSIPAETTTFLVAVHNTVGPGLSDCEGVLGGRFRLQFSQRAKTVSCPKMSDVSCEICTYEGCNIHGVLAGSARATSFFAETAWQVVLAIGRIAVNTVGGLAPPVEGTGR